MPDYGPQENGRDLFLERTTFGQLLIAVAGYGAQVILYVICLLHLWSQRKRRTRAIHFLIAYMTALLMLESLNIIALIWIAEDVHIDYRNYPGGPIAYVTAAANRPAAEFVILIASLIALTFLSDLLVLWRCWVIWASSRKLVSYAVIMLPAILLLASLLLGILWAVQPNQSPDDASSLASALGTVYYVTSFSVNILATALITLRLLLHRRMLLKNLPLGHATDYLSVTAIFIESAALYSAFALACIVSIALDSPMYQVFVVTSSACQQIAGYLIIIRVARGHAWNSATLATTDIQFTTVHFQTSVTSTQNSMSMSQNAVDMES